MAATKRRLFLGGAFVLVGIFLILRNLGFLDFNIPYELLSWESVFIIVGAIIIFSTNRVFPGAVFIAIGFFNMYPELWPLILVAIGIGVIYGRSGKKLHKRNGNDNSNFSSDILDDVAIFGGGHKIIDSDNFKGGEAVAIFGGSEIDLMGCKLAEGNNVIDLTAIFGGTTFVMPKNWNVQLDVISIFGGFSDKRYKDPDAVKLTDRTLRIKGLVLFGGGEIK